MRFARYGHAGAIRDAVLGDGDLLYVLANGQDIDALIRRGGLAALLSAGTAALAGKPGPAVTDVRLLAPLHPASIRDSVSFEAHIEGARKSQEGAKDAVPQRWYEAPCFYFTNPHACVGAQLFREEAKAALRVLTERLPELRLAPEEAGTMGRSVIPRDGSLHVLNLVW